MENAIDAYKKPFPTRLRKLMEDGNVTQQMLASHLSIKRQSVSQYMDGKATPNPEKLCCIADFFNVSTDYILGRSEIRCADQEVADISIKTGLSVASITSLMGKNFWFTDRLSEKVDLLNVLIEGAAAPSFSVSEENRFSRTEEHISLLEDILEFVRAGMLDRGKEVTVVNDEIKEGFHVSIDGNYAGPYKVCELIDSALIRRIEDGVFRLRPAYLQRLNDNKE